MPKSYFSSEQRSIFSRIIRTFPDKEYFKRDFYYVNNQPLYLTNNVIKLSHDCYDILFAQPLSFGSESSIYQAVNLRWNGETLEAGDQLRVVKYMPFNEKTKQRVKIEYDLVNCLYESKGYAITEQGIFLDMIFFEGKTVEKLIQEIRNGSYSLEFSLVLANSICEAFQQLYSKHIVHCDLKPDNMIYTKNEEIKIIDFQEAGKIIKPETSIKGFGAPLYTAPETIVSHDNTLASSIYSLGVILQEVLLLNKNELLFQKVDKSFLQEIKNHLGAMLNQNPKKRPTPEKTLRFFSQKKEAFIASQERQYVNAI